jgi:uncharacterized protein (UPF0332 family)
VKHQTALHLAKARQALREARQIAAIRLAQVAARSAYYAAFHAAEAFIYERLGNVPKTHDGVRIELARLLKHEPRIGRDTKAFLAQAYKYKEISDYATDLEDAVPLEDAKHAIAAAEDFINALDAILP